MLGRCNRQLAAHRLTVLGGCAFAVALLRKVIEAQGENRQSVDRAAERFGVLRGGGRTNNSAAGQIVGDPVVDFFDPVVSLLVQFEMNYCRSLGSEFFSVFSVTPW